MASKTKADVEKKTPPAAAHAQPQPRDAKAKAAKPGTPPPENEQDPEDEEGLLDSGRFLKTAPAWLVSMLLHIVVLLAMALIVSAPPKKEAKRVITSTPSEEVEELEDMPEEDLAPDEPEEMASESGDAPDVPEVTVVPQVQIAEEIADVAQVPVEISTEISTEMSEPSTLLRSLKPTGGGKGGAGGGFGGRGKGRGELVKGGGGSGASEAAVDAALKWIINHQLPDGSWSFAHDKSPKCKGECSHPGKYDDNAGATAMALLPLLGRGYTHKEGPYRKEFEAGITYLATRAAANGGNVANGGSHPLYVQGLAGIVLSEAYAMSQDRRLKGPAQAALVYIMEAQDPVGGGWRYWPKQPGDTSAVGWQLMALKSGYMASLQVNPMTIKKASDFLDSVQSDSGSAYGYMGPGQEFPMTACGLLCRMYLGWKKDNPALQRGVARLSKQGPTSDIYYDYYATQVMHHMEGDEWTAWNAKMRDGLINAQSKSGHETGSWFDGYSGGVHHSREYGGRLYITSMATMILEVYYRHLPLYGSASVEEEFKE